MERGPVRTIFKLAESVHRLDHLLLDPLLGHRLDERQPWVTVSVNAAFSSSPSGLAQSLIAKDRLGRLPTIRVNGGFLPPFLHPPGT